jgi:hypothetical protein
MVYVLLSLSLDYNVKECILPLGALGMNDPVVSYCSFLSFSLHGLTFYHNVWFLIDY